MNRIRSEDHPPSPPRPEPKPAPSDWLYRDWAAI
jgi:hypothetical protein